MGSSLSSALDSRIILTLSFNSIGLELAKLADLPDDVMSTSRKVAETLSNIEAQKQASSKVTQVVKRRKAILSVQIFTSSPFVNFDAYADFSF